MTYHDDELHPPGYAPQAHLDDNELLEDTIDAQKHRDECAWCTHRAEQVDQIALKNLDELLNSIDETPIYEPTQAFARTWHLPTTLSSYLVPNQPQPRVAPGQLWRLSWNGETMLVVVIDRERWELRVAPVITDTDLADEYTLLFDATALSFGEPAAAFTRAITTVPLFTFDIHLGDIHTPFNTTRALRNLENAHLAGAAPADDIPTGDTLNDNDWDRHAALNELRDIMRRFSEAAIDIADLHDPATSPTDTASIVDAFRRTNPNPIELAELTGITLRRLVDLQQQGAQPTRDELHQLSAALDMPLKRDIAPESLDNLIEVTSDPQYRTKRRAWNLEHVAVHDSPDTVVPLVHHLIEYRLAARMTGTDTTKGRQRTSYQDWEDALAQLLAQY